MSRARGRRRSRPVGGRVGSAAYAAALEQAGAALERAEVAGVSDDQMRGVFLGLARRVQAEHAAGRSRPPAVRLEQLAGLLDAAACEQRGGR